MSRPWYLLVLCLLGCLLVSCSTGGDFVVAENPASSPSPAVSPSPDISPSPSPSPSPQPLDWVEFHDLTAEELEQKASEFGQQGYRMDSLNVYGPVGGLRYEAVMIRADLPERKWVVGQTAAEVVSFIQSQQAEGYVPVVLNGAGSTSSNALFVCMVEKSEVPTTYFINLNVNQLAQTMAGALSSNDQIPVQVSAYADNGTNFGYYCVLLQKERDLLNWGYYYGQSQEEVETYEAVYNLQGVRLQSAAQSNAGHFLSIWYDDTLGEQVSVLNLDVSDWAATLEQMKQEGLVPLKVSVTFRDGGGRFSAIFVPQLKPVERQWTVTGPEPGSDLAAFDHYIQGLMEQYGVRAASFALVRQGRLLMARGYTLAEPGYPITQPTTLFRIASCTKPITSTAVHQLIQSGQLTYEDGMQDILSITTPSGAPPVDPRWNEIRIWELLSHLAGWNVNKLGFDPMFDDFNVAAAFNAPLPVTKYMIASFMATYRLNSNPGEVYAYSNFGFSLLGQILERKYPGMLYKDIIQQQIFTPLGLTRPYLGGSLLGDQGPDEARYQDSYPSVVFSVITPGDTLVPYIYGGSNIANMDSHGAWVMAAPDYAKFLAAFDLGDTNPLLNLATTQEMWTPPLPQKYPTLLRGWFLQMVPDEQGNQVAAYWHNGWLDSDSSLIFRRQDGLSMVLLFNEGIPPYLEMDPHGEQLNALANQVQQWPTTDLFPAMGIPSF